MAPNKNVSYGVGAKTNSASPFRRNVNNERGSTRRASPIIYPESVLTRGSTFQPQTRNRIGMQLLRELSQSLPTTPSRISPAPSGSRRLRPPISRAGQLAPSQMVLNRPMPMQSRTALGVVPVPQGIGVREVSAKESSRRVRIKNQEKEVVQRTPSLSMTNIRTARKSPMRKASTLFQQYSISPLSPVIMVDAQEDPDVKEEDAEPQDIEPADRLEDENETIASAAQPDEVEHRLSGDSAANEDKDPASVASSPQAEEVEPPAGAEEPTEETASCQQDVKIYPCFRGEYPTRNRAAPYQWFEKTGFNPGGIAPGACTCKQVESGQNPGEENILTTCEVTEEHFMSIGCECDEKPPHFMGCLSGEQGQQMPQHQVRPYCREQQQLPRCMQQQQAAMFRSYPNMYSQQQRPSCCGLTKMLAQQLHQQMQEAQAQIAQVQLQLKNACGSTQVQQLNINDNCSSEDPYWPGEDLDEGVSVGGEETDYATEQSMNISCSAMYQEEEQQKAPQDTGSCVMMPYRSCLPSSQPPPCYAAPSQQQQQQQAQIPCQQRSPCQQQQQKCFPEPFPCQQQQQSPPPPHQQPPPAPFQQQPTPPPPSCQMQQQQQLLMHILQQQQKLLMQQQEQKQQPPKQQQNPRKHPQQQHSMQGPKLFQQQHQSHHNMCPHLTHCCPSCYCQRCAKMRFMMPRRWPC